MGRISWTWWSVPAIWTIAALVPTIARGRPIAEIGIHVGYPLKAFWAFLFACGLICFSACMGVYAFRRLGMQPPLMPAIQNIHWPTWVIYQVLYIALPEELFFRGYLQSNIERLAGHALKMRDGQKPSSISGTAMVGVAGSSVLFAGAHVAVLATPAGMWAFLPGLLFGWLRAHTGSIWASVLSHAAANVAYVLACRSLG